MSFFNDRYVPFEGVDIGWGGDPPPTEQSVGDYKVLPTEPPAPVPFTHFKILIEEDGGYWTGYVGNGILLAPFLEPTDNTVGLYKAVSNITHEGTAIDLDPLTDLPYEDGLENLKYVGASTSLSSNTKYYVYLKIRVLKYPFYRDNDTDYSGTSTADIEFWDVSFAVTTLFSTTLQESGNTPSSNGSGEFYRYIPIGVVSIPATGTSFIVEQWTDNIPVKMPMISSGLAVSGGSGLTASGYNLLNAGVLSVTDDSGAVTVDNTDPQNPVVTNPP